jgi:amino acid adenylation domain-containing protein
VLSQMQGFLISPQQRRAWAFQQPGGAYAAQSVLLLEGLLDHEALRAACNTVVERHDALRTLFQRPPGMKFPVQVIAEEPQIVWHELDLSELLAAEQDLRVQEVQAEQRAQPFDLEHGPLLRLALLRLAADRHLLLIQLPALSADARTMTNLVGELCQAYAAQADGSALSDEIVQYVQFSEWQNDLAQEEDAEDGRAFWRLQHVAAQPALPLPFERHASADAVFQPATVTGTLPARLCAELTTLAEQQQASLDDLLFACWQILLARRSAQATIASGKLFDGRKFEELEGAFGLFAAALPIQTRIDPRARFDELLPEIRRAVSETTTWQEYFFLDHPEAERSACELLFAFEQRPSRLSVAGLSWSILRQDVYIEPFKLRLSCAHEGRVVALDLAYDAARFSRADAECLLEQFQALAQSVALNPQTPIEQLNLLSAAERQRLLREWNATDVAYPSQTVMALFAAQAARTPEAIALRYADQQLSYAELNERANQLARQLRSLGVGPDVPVALCMERSLELVVGVLGVLKAGGVYVPLDPSHPAERLRFLLDDMGAALLLTQSSLADTLPAQDLRRLCLDTDWPAIAAQSSAPLDDVAVLPDHLAYVIYTSGSTGTPKGVMVTHGGLTNYLSWAIDAYAVGEGQGAPLHSPLGFDLTVTSLFTPLLTGGTVVLVPEEQGVSGLSSALAQGDNFSLVKLTPAHLDLLAQTLPAGQAAGKARAFVIGGEALRGESLAFWREHAPTTRLINEYGPTETVVGCCVYDVPSDQPLLGTMPIGRPIANTRLYILDAQMQPVPIGVAGELYIGGDGLARGYLKRADLTAASFRPDPFGAAGARLYKTGDLARYRADGLLEFLGRIDYQVKIRGYRIELGEIEALLAQHPAVREVVVIDRDDAAAGAASDRRLVAYVVTHGQQPLSAADARAFLEARLPEYMVPSAFVTLDALPLTANGKVDRKALPVPDERHSGLSGPQVLPRTPIEEVLTGLWSQTLGREQISIHDNFFDLGGHSLLATQLIARIRESLQVTLPVPVLFDAPTIATLAVEIERASRAAHGMEVPPLLPVARSDELALSFAQQRLWFMDQLEPGTAAYNLPNAVRLEGVLDLGAMERGINDLVRRHESLRTTFAAKEIAGELRPIQIIAPELRIALPLVDLQALPEAEREAEALRLANEEASRPFDLRQGPLLRATLLRLSDTDHMLLLTMHHIVSDGWSTGVLVRDLAALYEAHLTGAAPALPALPVQYADYAAWQRQWLRGEILERQLSYWKQQLRPEGGELPVLKLPTDRVTADSATTGAAHWFELTPELTESLKALSRRENSTLFMTLLTAFQSLLFFYAEQDDLLIGTPIANRSWAEVEDVIGFFVNTLVLRADLSGDPTFRELLQRSRATALGAYAHQDLPFEKLVDEIQSERHGSLFRVWFVLEDDYLFDLELPGLSFRVCNIHSGAVRHDLRLALAENAGGLEGAFEYKTALFQPATIARMARLFQAILPRIVEQPEIRLSELRQMLATIEQQQRAEQEQATEQASLRLLRSVRRSRSRGAGVEQPA